MDEEPIEIRFDPRDREQIPAEVLEALPPDPDRRDSFLKALEGDAVYRRGPATSDMDLVRYHDSNVPTRPDSPSWHVPQEDAREYALTASVHDMRQAVGEADAAGRLATDEARAYARGPGSPIDINEGVALPRRWGQRDMESRLHVPRGAHVVTIESRASPQQGGGHPANTPANEQDDYRVGTHAYPGGNRQVLVITYDKDHCAVTSRPLPVSVDLRKADPLPVERQRNSDLSVNEDDIRQTAAELVARAKRAEPEISSDLSDVLSQTGGRQFGHEDDERLGLKDQRFKSQESVERKLTKTMTENDIGAADAGDLMNDVLRYTAVYSHKELADGAHAAIMSLGSKGYDVKLTPEDNKWLDESPGSYRGINITVEAPNGTRFELQFHTPESFAVKQAGTHDLYEIVRNDDRSEKFRDHAELVSKLYSGPLLDSARPPGVERIGSAPLEQPAERAMEPREEAIQAQLKMQQQALLDLQRAHQAGDNPAYDAAKVRWEQARENEEKLRQGWDGPSQGPSQRR